MTYSGSTSNTSYSKRTYNKKDNEDLAKLAKAMDTQRKETVNEFKSKANDQISEMDRGDAIQTNNDKYEIQNLAKFSDTLNEFLKTSVETVGKAYIDNKRRDGIEKQRKYQAGDESVREEIDGNKAQLEEINNKVNEMSQKVGESTDAFLSRQNAEKISLQDKLRALNVRKLGSNVRWGFVRATFQESAAGYKSSLIDSLSNDESTFTTKDGTPIKINDYHSLVNTDHKKEIEDYLEDKYIAENNPYGAANVVRDNYLTAAVVKATDEYRASEYIKERARQGELEQTSRTDQLISTAQVFDDDIISTVEVLPEGEKYNISQITLADNIQNFLTYGSGSESLKNSNVSPFKANKTQTIKSIKAAIESVDSETAAEIVEFLKEYNEFNMVGRDATIESHFAGDLDLDKILADHINANADQQTKLEKGALKAYIAEKKAFQEGYYRGDTLDQYKDNVRKMRDNENYLRYLPETKLVELLALDQWTPNVWNIADSRQQATEIQGRVGYLTDDDIYTFDKTVRDDIFAKIEAKDPSIKYKPKPIWNEVGKSNWGKMIETAMSPITQDIDKVLDGSSKDLTAGAAQDAAVEGTRAELLRRANNYYLNGSNASDALAAAKAELDSEMQTKTGFFTMDSDNSFANPALNVPIIDDKSKISNQFAEAAAAVETIEALQKYAKNDDSINNVQLVKNPNSPLINLTKNAEGKFDEIPHAVRAVLNSSGSPYTAIDFIIAQRAKHPIHENDPYTVDMFSDELVRVHNAVKDKYPHLAKIFGTDAESNARAIDEMGAVDLNTLTNSVIVNVDNPINAGDLDGVLEREGINLENYENDAGLREEVHRKQVNHLLKKAVTLTNDKNTAILMVATGMRFGEGSMMDYSEGSIHDSINNQKSDYAFAVLDGYYSGDTSKLINTYSNDSLVSSSTRGLTKTEQRLDIKPNFVVENILKNDIIDYKDIEGIDAQLAILENPDIKPEKFIKIKHFMGHSFKYNPIYNDWEKRVETLQTVKGVYDDLRKGKSFETRPNRTYLLNILSRQYRFDKTGKQTGNEVDLFNTPFYTINNSWMEQHGDKYIGANKKTIQQLNKQKDENLREKAKEYLGIK